MRLDVRRKRVTGISGTSVTLRPSRESDRHDVFHWLAESDVTPSMMGPPLFPEVPAPTWDDFNLDYGPNFFDGSTLEVASSYIIEVAGESVGQVNYEIRDNPARHAELDIWLRSLADTSHGYGSDALVALTDHLSRSLGVDTFLIRPSARNPRAIRAYQKAGFIVVPMSAREQVDRYGAGEYEDAVVLVKHVSA
jgi:RimJ/RimL family protein N-acetyltransferase